MTKQGFPEDPALFFREWLAEAEKTEPNDPNAMCLATAGTDGQPHARMVLLKGLDESGYVFYTNTESDKGRQLAQNALAALCFHWKSLGRQVRIEGTVEAVAPREADAYFATRPRGSQLGAWASAQSRPLDARETFETRLEDVERLYRGKDIPRPPHWSGYRVIPRRVEFWQAEEFRLHWRIIYEKTENGWTTGMLYP